MAKLIEMEMFRPSRLNFQDIQFSNPKQFINCKIADRRQSNAQAFKHQKALQHQAKDSPLAGH